VVAVKMPTRPLPSARVDVLTVLCYASSGFRWASCFDSVFGGGCGDADPSPPPPGAGCMSLYTILPCRILYGVWHTNGGSEGGQILRNSIARVMQPCRQCRWGGGNERMIDSCTKPRSEWISCKGQVLIVLCYVCSGFR